MVTYLDSGVLLSAWKVGHLHNAAMSVIDQEDRQFVSSQLVKLELLPKPMFEKRFDETAFYQSHFSEAKSIQPLDEKLGIKAQAIAEQYGLAAVDALHIASAQRLGVEEFYTSEKPGKPMFRVKELKVVSLHSL